MCKICGHALEQPCFSWSWNNCGVILRELVLGVVLDDAFEDLDQIEDGGTSGGRWTEEDSNFANVGLTTTFMENFKVKWESGIKFLMCNQAWKVKEGYLRTCFLY